MSHSQTCAGCGRASEEAAVVPCCDDCKTLVQAAVASLRPTLRGEGAGTPYSPRASALLRARLVAKQAIQMVDALADDELPEAEWAEITEVVNAIYARLDARRNTDASFVARMQLIDMVEWAAARVGDGSAVEDALKESARRYSVVWPEHAGRVDFESFRAAVRSSIDANRPSRGSDRKWDAILSMLVGAGLVEAGAKASSVRTAYQGRWIEERDAAEKSGV